MPLYEYECDACGHRFEVIQKFSDTPIEKCPACGGAVHKLQSAPSFQFKGSGWYITDYAKKDGAGSGKADSSSKNGSSAASDKTDKAPAASDAASKSPSTPASPSSTSTKDS